MADWASARRVPSGEAHEVWTRKKSMKRTKIDTRVDLRFVCIDCSGGAVKAAHVMEKKQEVFFCLTMKKLQIIPFGHIFTWTASPVQPFNTGGYSRGTDDGGGGEISKNYETRLGEKKDLRPKASSEFIPFKPR